MMLVEEDAVIRQMVKTTLEQSIFQIVVVEDFIQVLRIFVHESFASHGRLSTRI